MNRKARRLLSIEDAGFIICHLPPKKTPGPDNFIQSLDKFSYKSSGTESKNAHQSERQTERGKDRERQEQVGQAGGPPPARPSPWRRCGAEPGFPSGQLQGRPIPPTCPCHLQVRRRPGALTSHSRAGARGGALGVRSLGFGLTFCSTWYWSVQGPHLSSDTLVPTWASMDRLLLGTVHY